ncbi:MULTISPECIES: hypothetical protein [unclassified Pseudomonas]|uniref:hypothetical protein n=1 Tax=unclassified Pseudomonas TaxID=196821 RepID=UPI000C86CB0C|nr:MULTISPECIES: hypothetical protein [unclassified Pseudomonas]PMV27280.1 hypothetical protein C1X17_00395 [Pseudomonas sp. FW305-3-2-15-C-TSA2]PMV32535.1 hypothetical protein C1X22_00395 [Pseudomonas sp. DP16D-L5]PMV42249.1 hypothetical protein C1X21_00395 [Pseudomonas sp. FW305-3-2-15-A-LB2]PMV49711.1 hypothetical protein C1X16_02005 [Pseudomonas sp. FW305-3-2-15-C-R2A1]PMV55173.1 hypothetical protein C1X18_00395 [Pseudomonas sp. FW305-3-2-15-C-LB1]
MDDEGDFKKARGFLLMYSALVLALWYFGADLTQFKLMGNEIKLQHRIESVWLVLALLNMYFWFRCYQRLPTLGLCFDKSMNDLYDTSLIWSATHLKRRALYKSMYANFAKEYDSVGTITFGKPQVKLRAYFTLTITKAKNGNPIQIHQLSRTERTTMELRLQYDRKTADHWSKDAGSGFVLYSPSPWTTLPIKAFTIARGAFITPWFTDYFAPLALGGFSIICALCKWYTINF